MIQNWVQQFVKCLITKNKNMKNEKLSAFINKAKVVLTHTGKIVIIIVAMVIGFIISDVNHRLQAKKEKETNQVVNLKNVHSLSETSIAINERSELMVIDRRTGTYEIYQDSIGTIIFNLYAGKIYSSKTNTNPTQGE